jgi:EAL domain-containing protein (putative c-di-GMP-specific phosphodiesterase class I)
MATYVNTSIHFPDPKLLKRIRAVAKAKGIAPSAFIREAAERAVAEEEKKAKRAA